VRGNSNDTRTLCKATGSRKLQSGLGRVLMTYEMIHFLRTHIQRASIGAPRHFILVADYTGIYISLLITPSCSHEQALSTKTTLRRGKKWSSCLKSVESNAILYKSVLCISITLKIAGTGVLISP